MSQNKIFKYKEFLENANANASNTSGMGSVVASQPGATPGTPGSEGSGDVSFVMGSEPKDKTIKKGDASEVTDLRYLEDESDEVTKIEEL